MKKIMNCFESCPSLFFFFDFNETRNTKCKAQILEDRNKDLRRELEDHEQLSQEYKEANIKLRQLLEKYQTMAKRKGLVTQTFNEDISDASAISKHDVIQDSLSIETMSITCLELTIARQEVDHAEEITRHQEYLLHLKNELEAYSRKIKLY